MQARLDLKHLQFPEQLRFLQPHFASSWQQAATAGNDVQFDCQFWSSSFQPHCFGFGSGGSRIRDWPHTWPAWYTALFVFSRSADSVGGIISYDFCLCANKSNIASFTLFAALERSYKMTTNCSRTSLSSSNIVSGILLSLRNTSVASSNTFQACNADFLPLPRNADTVSQPVKA